MPCIVVPTHKTYTGNRTYRKALPGKNRTGIKREKVEHCHSTFLLLIPVMLSRKWRKLKTIPNSFKIWYGIHSFYLKGFVTKRDIRHFWKAEIKGKNCWFFPLYLILQPLITFSVYIFNLSNKATVVGGRDYWNLLFQLIKWKSSKMDMSHFVTKPFIYTSSHISWAELRLVSQTMKHSFSVSFIWS